MSEKPICDIRTPFWYDFLPDWLVPYAQLARWDRPVGIWLLFIPCLWGMFFVATSQQTLPQLLSIAVLFLIGSVAMRGAGCIINDLWDRDLDRKVARTKNRPLASGVITRRQAFVWMLVHLLIGALVLFQFNKLTILIGLASLPLIILYPLMKRITFWPQAFLGITFNWGVLLGATVITGKISPALLWLYGAAVLWTLAYDTIYAFQDIEDDIRIGVRSTARLFNHHVKPVLTVFYCLMMFCLCQAGDDIAAPNLYFIGVGIFTLVHLIALWRYWNLSNPASSLKIFKYHVLFGWGLTLILVFKFLLTVSGNHGTIMPI